MNSLMAYSSRVSTIRRQVRGAMEIAVFIQNIQEERAEVALYIFLNNSNAHFDMSEILSNNNSLGIQERFSKTDRALEECSVERFFRLRLIYLLLIKTGKQKLSTLILGSSNLAKRGKN